jgi:hypothetical protein
MFDMKLYNKNYYLANKERILERTKTFNFEHKQHIKQYQREYYRQHKESLIKKSKVYYHKKKYPFLFEIEKIKSLDNI